MFKLDTERLRLIPLTLEKVRLLLEDKQRLERSLGLQPTDTVLDESLREALENYILPNLMRDEEDYRWYTDWKIVLKAENRIIGGFCFKGCPNENGEVEIGYGMEPEYRCRGYMTEALRRAIQWAFEHPQVSSVIAETERTNVPSSGVLQKLGMVQYRETDKFLYWRLSGGVDIMTRLQKQNRPRFRRTIAR